MSLLVFCHLIKHAHMHTSGTHLQNTHTCSKPLPTMHALAVEVNCTMARMRLPDTSCTRPPTFLCCRQCHVNQHHCICSVRQWLCVCNAQEGVPVVRTWQEEEGRQPRQRWWLWWLIRLCALVAWSMY